MGRQIAVSFEDESVRVVYASARKGGISVHETLVMEDEAFDRFLAQEKSRDFLVCCQFKAFYSDTISLPPAKDRYLGKIVQSEIRKRHPECRDFSCFFTILGKKEIGAKTVKEVFYYAVDNAALDGILERFSRHDKRVTLLCPDVLAMAHLVRSSGDLADKTVLCVAVSDAGRTLFLMKQGEVRFVRALQSMGRDIQEMDIDNIHMTVSYCRQSLRLDPRQIVLMNTPHNEGDPPLNTMIPAIPVSYPPIIGAPLDTMREFLAPIATIMAAGKLKQKNLVPHKVQALYRQGSLLVAGIAFFALFALLGLGYLGINFGEMLFARGKVQTLRAEKLHMETVLADYRVRSASLQELLTLVNAINEARSGPDIQKAILDLRFLPMQNVMVKALQIKSDKDTLVIHLSGSIAARTFTDLHGVYQVLLEHIRQVSGMTVRSENLDLQDGSFEVDIQYKA
jgi:hypothetical protein